MNNCNVILLVKKFSTQKVKQENGNKMNTIKLKTNTQDKEEKQQKNEIK